MSKCSQPICKEVIFTLRKMAFLSFEICLSATGTIVASMLMRYCFNFFHYIAKEGGFSIVVFWVITVVSVIWISLINLGVKLWSGLFVEKYKITFFSSLPKSFATGFMFTLLYILLCGLLEQMPSYRIIERFFWVVFFIALPMLSVVIMYLLLVGIKKFGTAGLLKKPAAHR